VATLANITHRDPDILSGSLVFVGTRVPVRSLFDYLEGGESLDEFLHQFPSVKREFAIAGDPLRHPAGAGCFAQSYCGRSALRVRVTRQEWAQWRRARRSRRIADDDAFYSKCCLRIC
jgi:uncharacterized protein (DUF433 family)